LIRFCSEEQIAWAEVKDFRISKNKVGTTHKKKTYSITVRLTRSRSFKQIKWAEGIFLRISTNVVGDNKKNCFSFRHPIYPAVASKLFVNLSFFYAITSPERMAEQEDRKGKRFQNTPNTPETINISRSRIEHVYLKAPYTMNDKNKSHH